MALLYFPRRCGKHCKRCLRKSVIYTAEFKFSQADRLPGMHRAKRRSVF